MDFVRKVFNIPIPPKYKTWGDYRTFIDSKIKYPYYYSELDKVLDECETDEERNIIKQLRRTGIPMFDGKNHYDMKLGKYVPPPNDVDDAAFANVRNPYDDCSFSGVTVTCLAHSFILDDWMKKNEGNWMYS